MRKIDGSEGLLAGLLVFFGCLMVFCAIKIPTDGSTFTGLLSIATGLLGALGMKMKTSNGDDVVAPGTSKKTVTVEQQATPPTPPEPTKNA